MKKPGRIKSAIINWLGLPAGFSMIGSGKSAGQCVNQNSVLSLSAAWRCTRLIAETIGTLPIHVYERTDRGRRVAKEHPLYHIIHNQPNSSSTASMFWEAVVAAMLLEGNGLNRRQYISGRLVGLSFMPWNRLNISQSGDGQFIVNYINDDGTQTEIPKREIFHVSGFTLNGRWGISAIQYGASVFGSALAAGNAADGAFERGLSSRVAFTTDKILTDDQREVFKESLQDVSGGINTGKSPLLEAGIKPHVISINPRDAQLLESRSFSVEEVCRWFGVDPSMIGHGQSVSNWGTGLEQKMIYFLTFTLRPFLARIEQAINSQLLSPSDRLRYYAEFSIEGLLRADSAARASFYTAMVNNGCWTRDEVRAKENMPELGGNAAKLMVHSAMVPIDDAGYSGSSNQSESVRSALMNWINEAGDHE